MYLHLGHETIIRESDIIGIFDLDNTTVSKKTREYLNKAEKDGKVTAVSYELPKSFVICHDGKNENVYLSQLSPATLKKRSASRMKF